MTGSVLHRTNWMRGSRNPAGLRYFTLILPDDSELERRAARQAVAGIALTETGDGLRLQDPASNGILLRTA